MPDVDIRVEPDSDGWSYAVTLSEGDASTRHQVSLSREVYDRLTGGDATPEELVAESFRFLLEREHKESILDQFDITEISRYFPEYEGEIAGRLRR